MFGTLESEIAHSLVEVKPDYDGEMRMFQVELLLNIHMLIYEERSCNVLRDTYSTKQQLIPQKEKICYEKLRMCNQAKCRVNGKEKIDADLKILQILGQQAKLQGKRSKMTEQGIQAGWISPDRIGPGKIGFPPALFYCQPLEEIRDGYLYVNGDRYEEPYIEDEYRSGRLIGNSTHENILHNEEHI